MVCKVNVTFHYKHTAINVHAVGNVHPEVNVYKDTVKGLQRRLVGYKMSPTGRKAIQLLISVGT